MKPVDCLNMITPLHSYLMHFVRRTSDKHKSLEPLWRETKVDPIIDEKQHIVHFTLNN
jgi:hypothetical protein